MKSKKVLAILLSLAIMLTFMPTMAFADAGDPDTATYSVTIPGGATTTVYSFADAVDAVKDDGNGSITVTNGYINNPIVINAEKAFTLNVGDHLTSGVTVTAGDSACLIVSSDKRNYTYHPSHAYNSGASAKATSADPSKADVTVICDYGDSEFFKDVQGSVTKTVGDKTFYEATVTTKSGEEFTAEWEVSASAQTVYELVDEDYVKDNSGLAVLDAGKVQFYAHVKKDGAYMYNGTEVRKFVGTYDPDNDKTVTKPATADAYGESTYVVEFTLPDGKKEVKTFTEVKDTDKYDSTLGFTKGIQLKYTAQDGTEAWGDTLTTAPEAIATELEDGSVLDIGTGVNEGVLTYRKVKNTKDPDPEAQYEHEVGGGYTTYTTSLVTGEGKSDTGNACGYGKYVYNVISITETDNANGNTRTFTMQLPTLVVEGDHDYSNLSSWRSQFIVVVPATHKTTGTANATCRLCGKEWTDGSYVIPKTSDHTYVKVTGTDDDAQFTINPTCTTPGFTYKKCTKSDGGWEDGKYVLDLGENATTGKSYGTYTFEDTETNWHPVLVANSVVDPTGHNYIPDFASAKWEDGLEGKTADDDVTFTYNVRCYYGDSEVKVTAHKVDIPAGVEPDVTGGKVVTNEDGSIDIYDEITRTADPTITDCTKNQKFTYSTTTIEDAHDNLYSKTVTSEFSGAHDYVGGVTFTWSKNYKAATAILECQEDDCLGKTDENGNEARMSKNATVTHEAASYNTTKYTASVIVNGVTFSESKTVFDLENATINLKDNKFDSSTDLYEQVSVMMTSTIKISHKDSDGNIRYDLAITAPVPGEIVDGVNVITVSAHKGAYLPLGERVEIIGSKEFAVTSETKGQLALGTVKFDDEEVTTTSAAGDYVVENTYDADSHFLTVEPKYGFGEVAEGATVKYAVVDEEEYVNTEFETADDYLEWLEGLTYEDTAEFKNVGEFVVFVEISQQGYTTNRMLASYVEIEPKTIYVSIDPATMIEGEEPELSIRAVDDDNKVVDVDRDELVITSKAGKALTDLAASVDPYELRVTSENYDVWEDSYGKLIVLAKDGSDAEEQAKKAEEAAQDAIAAAAKIDSTYPAAEKAAVDSALADLKKATSVADKIAATAALNDAIAAAEAAKAVYAAADAAVADAAKITSADYLADSVKTVNDAKTALEEAVKSGNTADVKAKTEALNDAINKAVAKKDNPMKFSTKMAKVTTKKNKTTKSTTFKKGKALKVSGAKGKVKFKKANKAGGKKIVVKSNGKVIVKKGLKAGTYKVKVTATAKGNKDFKAKSVTKTLKVKVVKTK
jgi:hypothetical protein